MHHHAIPNAPLKGNPQVRRICLDVIIQQIMKRPDLEIKMKVLSELEGGRRTPFYDGYRGQLYYDNSDWDANYIILNKQTAIPGEEVNLKVKTIGREIHYGKFEIGKPIKIREGNRTIAKGEITKVVNQKFELWNLRKFQETTAKSLKAYFGDKILGFKIDFEHYLFNEELFDNIEVIEYEDVERILTIKLKKKEIKFSPIYQFITKQWSKNLTLGRDRVRIDHKLINDTNNLDWMNFQFATWNTIYMTGQIIVE